MPRRTDEERFWPKVQRTSDCWIWTAAHSWGGYGRFFVDGRLVAAHRFAYELLVGSIPDGLSLDHLCRNPPCVNPAHLEPVTNRENTLRGISPAAAAAKRDECLYGHPYDESNTYWYRNKRQCKVCRDGHHRSYMARRRADPERAAVLREQQRLYMREYRAAER